jgi:tetratricopeptide (TPR) repeat protein
MILPYPLSVYYGYDTVSLPEWTDFAGWGSVLLMGALIGVLLYRMKKKEIWVFGALFFLMGISMFSNLVPAVGIVAERFAFQASIGFSILVAALLSKWVGEEKSIRGLVKSKGGYVLLLIMIPSSIWTIVRNKNWESTGSIYLSDIRHMERSAKLNSLLGAYYADQLEMARSGKKPLSPQELRQKADSSAMFFARALEIFPDYAACSNNLGTIVFNFNNNIDSARACFLRAVKIDTLYTQAYFNLASTYEQDMAMYDLLRSSCGKAKFSSLDSGVNVINGSELHEIKKYFRSGSRLEKYLIAYLNSLIQSGSMEKVNSAFTGFSQDAKTKISEFYSGNEIRPNSDTLTKYFVEKGGAFIRNEIYGQPNDIIRFVVSTTLSYSISELAAKDKVDAVVLQNFANQQYRDATDKALDSYNKALLSKPDFLSAFDKLNNGYSSYGMYDSVISLNRRYIGNTKYFQEQLYANIGLAEIQLGRINDGIVSMEKAVAINEQNLFRLGIIYTQLGNARSPGFASAEKWYSGKRRELMNMYNLLSLKNSEIGQLERADHYRKLSEQYSK